MKKILILISIALTLFHLTVGISLAEDNANDFSDFDGFWSTSESCANFDNYLNVFIETKSNKAFTIVLHSGYVWTETFASLDKPFDGWVNQGDGFFAKFDPIDHDKFVGVFAPQNWNGYNLQFLEDAVYVEGFDRRYFKCDALKSRFELSYGELIAFADSDILEVCSEDISPSEETTAQCVMEVFKFLDVNNNLELHPAEITRGIRTLTSFALNDDSENNEYDDAIWLSSLALIPLLSKAVLANADYDGSGSLSASELLQDRQGLINSYSLAKKSIFETNMEFPNLLETLSPFLGLLNSD